MIDVAERIAPSVTTPFTLLPPPTCDDDEPGQVSKMKSRLKKQERLQNHDRDRRNLQEWEQARRDRRSTAFRYLTRLWKFSSLERVRKCCRCPVTGAGKGPVLRGSIDGNGQRRGGFTGLSHCGSVWACPVCSRKIAARRAEEISDAVRSVSDSGGSCMLLTLSMRHHRGMRLSDLWSAVSEGWRAVIGGDPWKKLQARYGILGWCRTVEVRLSRQHGWNVHLHALVFFNGELSEPTIQTLGEKMWNRWSRKLTKLDYESVAQDVHGENVGRDARKLAMTARDGANLGNYFTKVAFEVTSPNTKNSTVSRSPMGLLTHVIDSSDVTDLALWHEYEQASKGRRQLTWSADMKKWSQCRGEEVDVITDEEIATQDNGGNDLVQITHGWHRIVDRQSELLDAYETGGITTATEWLDEAGVAWERIQLRDDGHDRPEHGRVS